MQEGGEKARHKGELTSVRETYAGTEGGRNVLIAILLHMAREKEKIKKSDGKRGRGTQQGGHGVLTKQLGKEEVSHGNGVKSSKNGI